MIRKILIPTLGVCILLILGLFTYYLYQKDYLNFIFEETENEQEENGDPSNKILSEKGVSIYISTPEPGDTVDCNLTIEGRVPSDWFFEGSFPLQIIDEQGNILLTDKITTEEDWMTNKYIDFSKAINCNENCKENINLKLLKDNPSGLEKYDDFVVIDLKLKENCKSESPNTLTIKTFFSNTQKDPGALNCDVTYPTERDILYTLAVGRASVTELLKGVTQEESEKGYYSSIPKDVEINSLSIEDGVAKIDFNNKLQEEIGGSCKVSAIRSQIENTLKQFPTVEQVIVSIEGETEDILQP